MINGKRNNVELFDIERYSADVQTMMTKPPNWMVRWGITAVFFMMFVMFAISYFVKYPDIVKTSFTLTSYSPSVKIVSRFAGRVTMLVSDNVQVKKKQVLGYIENAASFEDVKYLLSKEDSLRKAIFSGDFDAILLKPDIQLGELQDSYISFLTNVNLYKAYIAENKLTKNIAALNTQKHLYEEIGRGMEKQTELLEKQHELSSARLKRDSLLYNEKIISAADIENSKMAHLPSEINSENNRQSITSNSLRIAEIENKKVELGLQETRFLNDLKTSIVAAYIAMQKDFELWRERYLFISPVDGIVSLFDTRSDNQYIAVGKEVIDITPKVSQTPVGVCLLPVQNSGKVKVGQEVSVDFSNFPAHEFGLVKGKIQSISTIPQQGMYYVIVEFPDGLNSDLKTPIDFKEQMTGVASIITEDLRLIERFFHNIRKAMSVK
ncbi:MAG: HlyD family efflux transporter periplasmic adaptor subunit [Niastella sp.]|nr:HlyD family efflux transporter periplasmic adaptor subunit [Niastella sp.]